MQQHSFLGTMELGQPMPLFCRGSDGGAGVIDPTDPDEVARRDRGKAGQQECKARRNDWYFWCIIFVFVL